MAKAKAKKTEQTASENIEIVKAGEIMHMLRRASNDDEKAAAIAAADAHRAKFGALSKGAQAEYDRLHA